MPRASHKKTRRRRFLDLKPNCYFCGRPATTIDHVPPRACFPEGYAPHGFESPACKECNEGTKKQDQIFGFYSMLVDFDHSKITGKEHRRKLSKLLKGIANNYPCALPDLTQASPVNRTEILVTTEPLAISVPVPHGVKEAIQMMGAKLTHALYLRETGRILTTRHQYFSGAYQPQRGGTQNFSSFLTTLLPNLIIGARSNIRNYGDRFRYLSGYKEDDLFCWAAQFGHGIILWGIVCGAGVRLPSAGPLASALWMYGAGGPGANVS
jgi:hypothetical protein